MRRADVPGPIDDLPKQLTSLGAGYQLLLADALRFQAEILGANPDVIDPAAPSTGPYRPRTTEFSEVVMTPDGLVVVSLETHEGGIVMGPDGQPQMTGGIRHLTLHGIGSPEVDHRVDTIASVLAELYDLSFEPYRYSSANFRQLVEEEGMTPPPPPSPDEVSGARLLVDPVIRKAALGVASSGGLLVVDLPRQLPEDARDRANAVASDLQASGLVTGELVVICRSTSAQVARVPDREALERAAQAGLKCACGRDVRQERCEQALSLTDLGRKLFAGSWWLTVLLIEELLALGIEAQSLLVEQTSGGEEMDCFADVSGELCFFELKDKEFSLGSAYSFGSKIAIRRPEHSIVVTTAYVGNDAKEHFKKAQPEDSFRRFGPGQEATKMHYFEGIETLGDDLRALVEEIYVADATQILNQALPHATMDGASVVHALQGLVDNAPTPSASTV